MVLNVSLYHQTFLNQSTKSERDMSVNSQGPIDRSGATAMDDQTTGLVTVNYAVARNLGDARQRALDTTNQDMVIGASLSDGKDQYGNLHIRFFDPLFADAVVPGTETTAAYTDLVETKSQVFTSFNGRKKRSRQETNEQIMARTMFAGFAQGTFTFGALTQDDSGVAGDVRAGESIFWRAPEEEMGNPGDLVQWQLRLETRKEIEGRKKVLPESNEYPPNRLTCEYKVFRPWRDVPALMGKVANSALLDQTQFNEIAGPEKLKKYFGADNTPQDDDQVQNQLSQGALGTGMPYAHEVYAGHVLATSVAAVAGVLLGGGGAAGAANLANELGLNARGVPTNDARLFQLMQIVDYGWLSPDSRNVVGSNADIGRLLTGQAGADDIRKYFVSAGRQQLASFVTAYRMEQSRIIAQLTGNAYSGRLASIIR